MNKNSVQEDILIHESKFLILSKKLVPKTLENFARIRYIGAIYSDGGNTEAVCKYKLAKQG